MAFTAVTVTGTFERADSTPAQGSVTLTLSKTIQNGAAIVEPTPIVGILNSAGQLVAQTLLPLVVVANDDPATLPVGSSYTILIALDSSPLRQFEAVISHSVLGATVDISALEPTLP